MYISIGIYLCMYICPSIYLSMNIYISQMRRPVVVCSSVSRPLYLSISFITYIYLSIYHLCQMCCPVVVCSCEQSCHPQVHFPSSSKHQNIQPTFTLKLLKFKHGEWMDGGEFVFVSSRFGSLSVLIKDLATIFADICTYACILLKVIIKVS